MSGYDGELDLAVLNIEHGICRCPLREDDVLLGALHDRPSLAASGQEGISVHTQASAALQLKAHVTSLPQTRAEFPGEDTARGSKTHRIAEGWVREAANRTRSPPWGPSAQ